MADFKIAYDLTMKAEGGYANNKLDSGGETIYGISRKNFPTWSGWDIVDAAKNLPNFPQSLYTNEELTRKKLEFYKDNFWNKLNLSNLNNQSIANELFDTAVNMGTGVAGLFLQRCLNVSNRGGKDYPDLQLDGNIGMKTILAMNSHPKPNNVLKALNCLQGAKYIAICEANPSQEIFFNSWFSRVFEEK